MRHTLKLCNLVMRLNSRILLNHPK